MANAPTAATGAAPSPFDSYQTSLTTRYCSPAMSQLFSQRSRHSTWRKLWLSLAECEKELGIDGITDEALEQMRARLTVTDEDFEVARIEEKSRRHVSDMIPGQGPKLKSSIWRSSLYSSKAANQAQ